MTEWAQQVPNKQQQVPNKQQQLQQQHILHHSFMSCAVCPRQHPDHHCGEWCIEPQANTQHTLGLTFWVICSERSDLQWALKASLQITQNSDAQIHCSIIHTTQPMGNQRSVCKRDKADMWAAELHMPMNAASAK